MPAAADDNPAAAIRDGQAGGAGSDEQSWRATAADARSSGLPSGEAGVGGRELDAFVFFGQGDAVVEVVEAGAEVFEVGAEQEASALRLANLNAVINFGCWQGKVALEFHAQLWQAFASLVQSLGYALHNLKSHIAVGRDTAPSCLARKYVPVSFARLQFYCCCHLTKQNTGQRVSLSALLFVPVAMILLEVTVLRNDNCIRMDALRRLNCGVTWFKSDTLNAHLNLYQVGQNLSLPKRFVNARRRRTEHLFGAAHRIAPD